MDIRRGQIAKIRQHADGTFRLVSVGSAEYPPTSEPGTIQGLVRAVIQGTHRIRVSVAIELPAGRKTIEAFVDAGPGL